MVREGEVGGGGKRVRLEEVRRWNTEGNQYFPKLTLQTKQRDVSPFLCPIVCKNADRRWSAVHCLETVSLRHEEQRGVRLECLFA